MQKIGLSLALGMQKPSIAVSTLTASDWIARSAAPGDPDVGMGDDYLGRSYVRALRPPTGAWEWGSFLRTASSTTVPPADTSKQFIVKLLPPNYEATSVNAGTPGATDIAWIARRPAGSTDPDDWEWLNGKSFSLGSPAPVWTTEPTISVAGRTVTVTVGTVVADPAAVVTVQSATLDGEAITLTGTGPWTYVAPNKFAAQTVAVTLAATNTSGTTTFALSKVVPAIANPVPSDLRIELTRTSGPAPMGTHAHITSDTATEEELRAIWRDCLVLWDFGADEDYTYQYLPTETRAVRTARYKQGPFTAHAFRTVGETTITCTVIHPAAIFSPIALTSPTITVLDANTNAGDAWTDSGDADTVDGDADGTHNAGRTGAFTGVISLAATPDWTGAPTNALRFTTLNAALDWLEAKPESSRRRLLFKAGETYEFARTVSLKKFSTVGRWGTGANPIIRRKSDWYGGKENDIDFWQSWNSIVAIEFFAAAEGCIFHDIAFRGDYSPVNPPMFPETGGTFEDAGWDELTCPIRFGDGDHYVTLDGLSSIGLWGLVIVGNTVAASSALIGLIQNDCHATDWYNYGSFGSVLSRAGYIGCAYMQNPNATRTGLRGTTTRGYVHNQVGEINVALHGPIRQAWCDRDAVWACHLDSRNDWSSAAPLKAPGGEQPCIRWMTGSYDLDLHGPGIPLMSAYCGGSHLRGGKGMIAAVPSGYGDSGAPRAMPIVDGCYLEMGFRSDNGVQTAYSEATLRNLVIVRPDYGADQFSFGDPTPENNDTGVTLIRIGNSFGDHAPAAVDPTGKRVRIANIVGRIDAATAADFFYPIGAGYNGTRPPVDVGSSVYYTPEGWSTNWQTATNAESGIVRVTSLDDLGPDLQPGVSVAGIADATAETTPAPGYVGAHPTTLWDFFGDLRSAPGRSPFSPDSDFSRWDSLTTRLNGLNRLPDAWAAANFAVGPLVGGLRVTLGTPPSSGATAATALEYRIDGGSWVDSGLTAPFESGDTFDVTGLTANTQVTVALRWTNADGYSAAGETRTVTPAGDFAAATATGAGTSSSITDTEDYTLWTFTGDGTLTFTAGGEVEYRMVGAGGGGGDSRSTNGAGGGGGGGRVVEGTLLVSADDVITITVPASPAAAAVQAAGNSGGAATILHDSITYTAAGGGGGGGGVLASAPKNGWHGGGGGHRHTGATGGGGNAGGNGFQGTNNSAGGGAGAGGAGSNGAIAKGGDGGAGATSTFSGTSETWGAGGGGAIRDWTTTGYGNGTGDPNTAGSGGIGASTGAWNNGEDGVNPGWGGGGGNGRNDATFGTGGVGGPGRVQIRYRR